MKFKRHPESEKRLKRWRFFERSYQGGDEYRAGEYLIQHERESKEGFKRRVDQAMFVNLCSPVIDLYNGYLYQPEHKRDYGSLENDPLFQQFLKDVDYDNHDYDSYIEQLSLRASIFGYVGVVVDKPADVQAATKLEQIEKDLRPYLIYYEPEAIFDWKHERKAGRKVLTKLVLLEESGKQGVIRYKIWYADKWEVWEQKGNAEAVLTNEVGDHSLGEIPFVIVPNNSPLGEAPSSDIKDISDVNREIYYIDSLGHEIMEGTAFPMLEEPADSSPLKREQGEKEVGVGSLLQRDPDDTVGHRWIEPPHSSLPHMKEWREMYVENIREIAKTDNPQAQSGGAQSGEALKIRLRSLTTVLTNKATAREQAECNILRLWAKWEDEKFECAISYERKFDVDGLQQAIDEAISAKAAVPSKTFANVLGMQVVERIVEDLDEETRKKIEGELSTTASDFGAD